MWQHAGLVRTRDGLVAAKQCRRRMGCGRHRSGRDPGDDGLRRVASLVTVGYLIARAALRREESRGGHFRADFPKRDDIHWKRHIADAIALSNSPRPAATPSHHWD